MEFSRDNCDDTFHLTPFCRVAFPSSHPALWMWAGWSLACSRQKVLEVVLCHAMVRSGQPHHLFSFPGALQLRLHHPKAIHESPVLAFQFSQPWHQICKQRSPHSPPILSPQPRSLPSWAWSTSQPSPALPSPNCSHSICECNKMAQVGVTTWRWRICCAVMEPRHSQFSQLGYKQAVPL